MTKANVLENAFAYVRGTIWEILAFVRELGEVCHLVGLTSFIHGKRMRNGLNEPGEDFLGTDVVPNRTCPLRLLLNFFGFPPFCSYHIPPCRGERFSLQASY